MLKIFMARDILSREKLNQPTGAFAQRRNTSEYVNDIMATTFVNELDTSKISLTTPCSYSKKGVDTCKSLCDNKQQITIAIAKHQCLACPIFIPAHTKRLVQRKRVGIVVGATDEMHDCLRPSRVIAESCCKQVGWKK